MKKTVSIIGGGACALMLGAELDPAKYQVTIYERNAALGRKFLVAGDGGLNITHSEDAAMFLSRYTPSAFLENAFRHFSNRDLQTWLMKHGVPTRVGTSRRVFPEQHLKPIEVLQRLEQALRHNQTQVAFKHRWQGFGDNGALVFQTSEGQKHIVSDLVIFCLGGASWPVTGSRGDWLAHFAEQGVRVNPFYPSNCAYQIHWPQPYLELLEGKALKNIKLSYGAIRTFGEVTLTRFGMEGSGVYPLSPQIRAEVLTSGAALLHLDLKPQHTEERIKKLFVRVSESKSISEHLRKELHMSTTMVTLLKMVLSKAEFLDADILAARIKHLPLQVTGLAGIDEAISTVGGIDLSAIDRYFELHQLPGCFAIGEMLDYDAPTGGYLLQSCFSMANYLAHNLNQR